VQIVHPNPEGGSGGHRENLGHVANEREKLAQAMKRKKGLEDENRTPKVDLPPLRVRIIARTAENHVYEDNNLHESKHGEQMF
jgi:hypothetical protein